MWIKKKMLKLLNGVICTISVPQKEGQLGETIRAIAVFQHYYGTSLLLTLLQIITTVPSLHRLRLVTEHKILTKFRKTPTSFCFICLTASAISCLSNSRCSFTFSSCSNLSNREHLDRHKKHSTYHSTKIC